MIYYLASLRMLPISLFYSDVTYVTGWIIVYPSLGSCLTHWCQATPKHQCVKWLPPREGGILQLPIILIWLVLTITGFLALPSANELRVTLSTDNDQSDYICASFVDVSCPCSMHVWINSHLVNYHGDTPIQHPYNNINYIIASHNSTQQYTVISHFNAPLFTFSVLHERWGSCYLATLNLPEFLMRFFME